MVYHVLASSTSYTDPGPDYSTGGTQPALPAAPSNSWNAKAALSFSTAQLERVPVRPGIF
jgi:hypothetical protein